MLAICYIINARLVQGRLPRSRFSSGAGAPLSAGAMVSRIQTRSAAADINTFEPHRLRSDYILMDYSAFNVRLHKERKES